MQEIFAIGVANIMALMKNMAPSLVGSSLTYVTGYQDALEGMAHLLAKYEETQSTRDFYKEFTKGLTEQNNSSLRNKEKFNEFLDLFYKRVLEYVLPLCNTLDNN